MYRNLFHWLKNVRTTARMKTEGAPEKCAWENDWSVKAAELKAYMGEWEKNER